MTLAHARSPGARNKVIAGIAVCLATLVAAGAFAPRGSRASSHREAPLVAADPQVDNTDVYAFVSPDRPSTVTLISNWIPLEEPAGGPNFYPFSNRARYDINIDNNGDAKADIIYRWKFRNHYRNKETFLYNTGVVTKLQSRRLNFFQTYDLKRIKVGKHSSSKTLVNNAIAAPSNVGDASMPDYAALRDQAVYQFGGTSRTFAGQADDPFFLDLRIFDLIYGADFSETGDDTLAGFNVNTLALQVPKTKLDKNADSIVGIWSTASRRSTRVQTGGGALRHHGQFVQVSRLGMPLTNEVVIPVKYKDKWNATAPSGDGQFLPYVQDPIVPHVVNAIYGIPVPDTNANKPGIQRSDLISVFLTGVAGLNQPRKVTPAEELRLNMGIPPCQGGGCSDLGVIGGDNAGFPNGRRLGDDVLDVALRVVEGVLIPNHNNAVDSLSDGVDSNDVSFDNSFPYEALPHSGSDASPH